MRKLFAISFFALIALPALAASDKPLVIINGQVQQIPSPDTLTPASLPVATTSALGTVKPDGTTITISGGVISSAGGATGANPTATASDTAVNGSATTFLRSDGAPAVQKATTGQFGLVKPDGSTITVAGGVISSTAGGYAPGVLPTLVQSGGVNTGGNSVTLGSAPVQNNLLLAMGFNPSSPSPGSGWTVVAEFDTGSDYGVILTKVAGASESSTQSPLTGVSSTGALVIWEIHSSVHTTPSFLLGQTQAEQTSQDGNTPILFPNIANGMGFSACAALSNPIVNVVNVGVQDVFLNSGTRPFVAGHTDLAHTPMAGVITTYGTFTQTKSATALVLN